MNLYNDLFMITKQWKQECTKHYKQILSYFDIKNKWFSGACSNDNKINSYSVQDFDIKFEAQ